MDSAGVTSKAVAVGETGVASEAVVVAVETEEEEEEDSTGEDEEEVVAAASEVDINRLGNFEFHRLLFSEVGRILI